MCGFVCTNDDNFEFQEALNKAKYRGPDFQDIILDSDIKFGHNRLSIIDISNNSNQPFQKKDMIMVFNGEIYNYRKIRNDLISKGIKFSSEGDTEVVLEAFLYYGENFLEKLNGMFSFLIYNKKLKTFFCAVDRLGVKPFYYNINNKVFTFASECWGMSKNISKDNAKNFLVYGYNSAPKTIYDDVFKLEPGTILKYNSVSDKASLHKYWKPESYVGENKLNFDQFKVLINDSVKLRLESDVPICGFLSGGIDSTLVAAILQKVHSKKIKYYTIGVHDNDLDESENAKQIAKYLNLDHEVLYFEESQILNIFQECIEKLDEPLGDSSLLPTSLVCRAASKEFKVAISADGGDEMCMGYPKYFGIKKNLFRNTFFKYLTFFIPKSIKIKLLSFILKGRYRADLFTEAIVNNFKSEEELLSHLSRKISVKKSRKLFKSNSENYINYKQRGSTQTINDLYNYLPNDILRKVDKASMSYSLEAREPFLDFRLFEVMLNTKEQEKATKNDFKKPLKKYLSELVPSELWDRPKKGFSIPINPWLRNQLNEKLKSSIKICLDNDLFDKHEIWNIFNDFMKGNDSDADFLWNILILGEFIKAK